MALSNAAKNKRQKEEAIQVPERPNPFISSIDSSSLKNGKSVNNAPQPSGPVLMDYVNPKPQPDTASEEVLKRRSKWNTLGRLIGSLGQLGGMASGGDAVGIVDNVSPFITGRLLELDDTYRNDLSNWANRAFQMDMHNNRLQNEERQAQRDNQFQEQRMDIQHQNAKAIAEQRAQDALKALQAKNSEAQAKEMRQVGVDPSAKDAMPKYLQAMRRKFENDLAYKNRMGRGSGKDKDVPDSDFVEVVRVGREKKLAELNNQLRELSSETVPDQNQVKALQDRIDDLRNLKVKKDNQVALDLYEEEMKYRRGPASEGFNSTYSGQEGPLPDNPDTRQGVDRFITTQSMTPVLSEIKQTGKLDRVPELMQMLIRGGYAQNEEEATQMIYEALNQ